eukprot:5129271-Pleurochrysis_carterae.AAC.1
MSCGDNNKCDGKLKNTGCPANSAKTWIMCEDWNGLYHADNHAINHPMSKISEMEHRLMMFKRMIPDWQSQSC